MGLDIRVYTNLQFLTDDEAIFKEDEDFEYDLQVFVIDPSWEDRIKNVKKGYYKGDYELHGPSIGYGSHGQFRKVLCKLSDVKIEDVWDKKHLDIPFYELIDFADNEGTLDYEVAEKLHKDFVDYKDRFFALEEKPDYFNNIYDEWIEVCKLAADKKGVIEFG